MFLSLIATAAGLGATLGGAIATITGASVVTGTAIGTVAGAGVGAMAVIAEELDNGSDTADEEEDDE